MSLISDNAIFDLAEITGKLASRVREWFEQTELEEDVSKRFPHMGVIKSMEVISKNTMAIAALDVDRARLALQAKGKGIVKLSERDYEEGMKQLREEAVREMSTEDMLAEIERRMHAES